MWWASWPYAKNSSESMFGYVRGVIQHECGTELDIKENEVEVIYRLFDSLYGSYGFPDPGYEIFEWEKAYRELFLGG